MHWTNRPGRLTAGLGLIGLGAALLIKHVYGVDYLPQLLRLWPLLFVGVGLELLLFGRGATGLDLGGLVLLVIAGLIIGNTQWGVAGPWGSFQFDFPGVTLGAQGSARYEHREEVALDGVEQLEIQSGSAPVEIRPAAGDQIRVVLAVTGRGVDEAAARRNAEAVRLEVERGRSARVELDWARPFVSVERLSLTVEVPPGVRTVTLDAGSGGGRIHGIAGNVRADLGSGRVRIEDVGGNIELETGSGGVEIRNPGGDVTLDGGSGSVVLETDRVAGDYRLGTGSGSIHVRIPRGSDVRVRAEVGSGSISGPGWLTVRDDVASGRQGAATYLLELEAGSGSIHLQERLPG